MGEGLNNIAQQMRDNKNAAISSLIDDIHKDMIDNVQNATIPYDVFGAYFLDHFKYGGVMDNEAPLTLKWLELAGGPYGEVDIVDNNGNIIITTPGMFCRPDIDDNVSGVDYSNLVSEYNLRANRLHADGVNYANTNLSGVGDGIKTKHDEFNFRWEAVFNRYENKSDNVVDTTKPKKDEDLSFLDFE